MQKDVVLDGDAVRLEPLHASHLRALRECANDEALWEFTFGANPFTDDDDAQAWLEYAREDPATVAFAVVEKASGIIAGSTRYLDIQSEHRKLEIGWTFIVRRFWRTRMNTEAKYLLLRHAFEEWNALRVQFKAEAINRRSREAILRLGATYEGTLRNFRIRPSDGDVRDTSFYSVTVQEWPIVKERLLSFLH